MKDKKKFLNDKNNGKIQVQIIMNFEVAQFQKKYIAYYIDDNRQLDILPVIISEYDEATNTIKNVEPNEHEIVKTEYLKLRDKLLME